MIKSKPNFAYVIDSQHDGCRVFSVVKELGSNGKLVHGPSRRQARCKHGHGDHWQPMSCAIIFRSDVGSEYGRVGVAMPDMRRGSATSLENNLCVQIESVLRVCLCRRVIIYIYPTKYALTNRHLATHLGAIARDFGAHSYVQRWWKRFRRFCLNLNDCVRHLRCCWSTMQARS